MMNVRNVSARRARGAALASALLGASIFALSAHAAPTKSQRPADPPPAAAASPTQVTAPVGPRPLAESVAAVVNDEIISTYDLAQRMRLLIATSGVQPTEQTLPEFEREALLSLVDEHLQMHELRRVQKEQKTNDIIATDDEVKQEVADMARQNNMKPETFMGALTSQGISPETLYQQIRAQMSWQRWIQGRYGTRLRIGEDQIKATQARMLASASKPQYDVSEILLDANRVGGMNAAIEGAKQLITQMQQGASFGSVARQFSAAPTAANGGDAGWVTEGELPTEVNQALQSLRPGQLSPPIPVKDGVYIVYLRDKRAGAGVSMVDLKQAAIALPGNASAADVEAARAKLQSLRAQVKGCDSLSAVAAKTPGVVAGDLGEAQISELAPEFRQAAETLDVGQLSEPIRTKVGLHLVAVCGKRVSGGAQLGHDEIESRLFGQQLSMISRRYMRDLRNSATIETR